MGLMGFVSPRCVPKYCQQEQCLTGIRKQEAVKKPMMATPPQVLLPQQQHVSTEHEQPADTQAVTDME